MFEELCGASENLATSYCFVEISNTEARMQVTAPPTIIFKGLSNLQTIYKKTNKFAHSLKRHGPLQLYWAMGNDH